MDALTPGGAARVAAEEMRASSSGTTTAAAAMLLFVVTCEAAYEPMDEQWLRDLLRDAATLRDEWRYARDVLSSRHWGVAAQTLAMLEQVSGREWPDAYAKRLNSKREPFFMLVRAPDVNLSPP